MIDARVVAVPRRLRLALELERRVTDRELRAEELAHATLDLVPRELGSIGHHDVRLEHRTILVDLPDVHVVDLAHPRNLGGSGHKTLEVEVERDTLHERADRGADVGSR